MVVQPGDTTALPALLGPEIEDSGGVGDVSLESAGECDYCWNCPALDRWCLAIPPCHRGAEFSVPSDQKSAAAARGHGI